MVPILTHEQPIVGLEPDGKRRKSGLPRRGGRSRTRRRRRLRRAAAFLRKIGIEISFKREARARTIHIAATPAHSATEEEGARPSSPSLPSSSARKSIPNGLAVPPLMAVANDDDGSGG